MYVYLWMIHVDVWQKTTKFCKAIILQLKINENMKKMKIENKTKHSNHSCLQRYIKTGGRLEVIHVCSLPTLI